MSLGSFFSGVFSTAGTAVGGFFSTVKTYIMVAVVVIMVIMAGVIYWQYSQNQLLVVNAAQLKDALAQEKNSFDQLKKDSDALVKNLQDLQNKENQIQHQNDLLEQKIRSYDFQGNAIKNHDKTEKTINDETDKLLKGFEHLSDPNNLSAPIDPPAKISAPKKGK